MLLSSDMRSKAHCHPRRPFDRWLEKPVIPVFSEVGANVPLLGRASVLCLQGVALAHLQEVLGTLEVAGLQKIPLLVHIDLLAGLTADEAGLDFLATLPRIDGIITVRPHLVPLARQLGLRSVLRMFLQDGRAVERGLAVAGNHRPDAIELLPGVAAIETAGNFAKLPLPRLAGGLIHSEETARRILASGCRAISTSDPKLWELNG